MRRFNFLLGLAIGYVLGAKAGRQRYEQIRSAWQSMARSEPATQLSAEFRGAASRAGHAMQDKASQGVQRVTAMVRGSDANGSATAGMS